MNIEVKSGGDSSNSNYNKWDEMTQDLAKTYNELNDEENANSDISIPETQPEPEVTNQAAEETSTEVSDDNKAKIEAIDKDLSDTYSQIAHQIVIGSITEAEGRNLKQEAEKKANAAKAELLGATASSDESAEGSTKLRSAIDIVMSGDSPIENKMDDKNDSIQRQLEDDLKNIDDMLRNGRITEEKAEQYRKEVRDKAQAAKAANEKENPQSETKPETINEGETFAKFQVVSGVSKEAEFKRLTGEDWPGENYYATCYGVDEGYDEPIENWTIYKRVTSEQSAESNATPENDATKEGEDVPEIDYLVVSEDDDAPEGDNKPEDDGAATEGEEPNLEENNNEVDLGEDALKNIEVTIGQDKTERLKEVEDKLNAMLPELAELYAKNRRIFVGAKNRAEFARVKGEYAKLLDESLKLKSEAAHNAGMSELSKKLQGRVDELNKKIQEELLEFAGGDFENTTKTQDELKEEKDRLAKKYEEALQSEYGDMIKELETKVSANFLSDYLEEASKLEDATIDALDNGTICRKFVSKVINNKYLKTALVAAAVAGLAATGVGLGMGLAAGTMSASLGYTAGGVALGAGKGALMGGLMSRQDSKNSAVRGFASEEEIKTQLESIEGQDADTSNVTSWLLEQYSEANAEDASSNRRKTALSAGIGAALGGLMSGVHFNNIETHEVTEQVRTGMEPDTIKPDLFDNVDVARGGGMYDSFTQMGGNPDDLQKALDIAHSVDARYSMVPGSNSITAGFNGQVGEFAHTYPGPISEWPDVAQGYMREVAEEWARQGLIPSHTITGGPIYDTITRTVNDYIPNAFMNFITRATATVGAGAIGGAIGGASTERSRTTVESTEPIVPSEESEKQEEPLEDSINDEPETIQEQQSDTENNIQTTEAEPVISSAALAEKAAAAEREHQARVLATAIELAKQEQESRRNVVVEAAAAEKEPQERAIAAAIELAKREQQARQEAAGNGTRDVKDDIIEEFSDKVGEEGIRIMTDESGLSDNNDLLINDWWNNLDDNTKNEVLQYELSLGNSTYGQALRVWLRENVSTE